MMDYQSSSKTEKYVEQMSSRRLVGKTLDFRMVVLVLNLEEVWVGS
jgi:hypothetical protein